MNNQRWLSFNYFTFFFTWGIFMPYWTGWLTGDKGLSVSAASIIIGAGLLTRSFSTLILFPVATNRFSISTVMKGIALLSLVLMISYIPFESYSVLLLITVLFSLIYPNLMPGVEGSATILLANEKLDYGKSRSFGSIGYTVALIVVGLGTSLFQEKAIYWLMLAGIVFIIFSQFQATPLILKTEPKIHKTNTSIRNFKKLFTSTEFLIILIISVLLQGSHTSYYNYGFIYLQDLGINSFYIGLILNVAVLGEILFFAKADSFLANMKISTMYIWAAIGSTLRWVLVFLFPNVFVFIGSQLLHVVSFGYAHYATIQFISKRLNTSQIPTAQGMYTAFAMSLINALLTFPAGFLYEVSAKTAFLGMIACTIPALLLTLATKRKYNY